MADPVNVIGNAFVKITPITSDFSSQVAQGLTGFKSLLSSLGIPKALLTDTAESVAGLGLAAGAALKFGSALQSAEAQVATQANISIKAADAIGQAFQKTAGTTGYSGTEITAAFSTVAGQLEETNGKALTLTQTVKFMTTAQNLASAAGTDLGTSTTTLATILQTFQTPVRNAGQAADYLFNAARLTGQGIDALGQSVDRVRSRMGAAAPSMKELTALVVDFQNAGETGRNAMTAMNTLITALEKPVVALAKAQLQLNVATKSLPPALDNLKQRYLDGTITSKQLTATTHTMTTTQLELWKSFVAGETAVVKAKQLQDALGVSITDTSGKMRPMGEIIGQLQAKIAGMNTVQATAELESLGFGTNAAQLIGVIRKGPAAFDAATAAVGRHNSVLSAAQLRSQTVAAEMKALQKAFEDVATQVGVVLLPALQGILGVLLPLSTDISNDVIPAFKDVGNALHPLTQALGDMAQALTHTSSPAKGLGDILKVIVVVALLEVARRAIDAGATMVAQFAKMAASALSNLGGTVATAITGTEGDLVTLGETATTTGETVGLAFDSMLGPIGIAAGAIILFHQDITNALNDVAKFTGLTAAGNWVTDHTPSWLGGGSIHSSTDLANYYNQQLKNVKSQAGLDKLNKQIQMIESLNSSLDITGLKKNFLPGENNTGFDPSQKGLYASINAALTANYGPPKAKAVSDGKQLAIQNGASSAATKLNASELALQTKALAFEAQQVIAIHSKNLNDLKTELNATHTKSLNELIKELVGTHNAKLKTLADKLAAEYVSAEQAKNAILTNDAKTASTALNAQVNLTTSTSLATLSTGLNATHNHALQALINTLKATHNVKLTDMVSQLVSAHKAALANWVAQSIAAQAASYLAQATGQAAISGLQETVREDQAGLIGLSGDALKAAQDQLNIDKEKLAKAQEDAILQAAVDNAKTAAAKATAKAALDTYDAQQVVAAQALANALSWQNTMTGLDNAASAALATYQSAITSGTATSAQIATDLAAWHAAVTAVNRATLLPTGQTPPPTTITISAPVTVHAATNATPESLAAQVADAVAKNNEQLVVLLTGRAGY